MCYGYLLLEREVVVEGFESVSALSQSTAACFALLADGTTYYVASSIVQVPSSYSVVSSLSVMRLGEAVEERNLVRTFASRRRSLKYLLAGFVIGG
jgi:hypothetical protein